jgi:spore coat polysaccharide biosynthesis predicted glycosyltransferase SpsG
LSGDAAVGGVIERHGFEIRHIPAKKDVESTICHCKEFSIDALVADSYELPTSYFEVVGKAARVLAVLDDLANRELPVTLVVNGSVGADKVRYRGAPHTMYLLGSRYTVLRPEFSETPAKVMRDVIERVLVTLGGSDLHGLTPRLMQWIAATLPGVKQDVVVGPLFSQVDAIRQMAQELAGRITIHQTPADMRMLMLNADVAVCGGGQTTYELAATGTPAIAIRTADNQTYNLEGLSTKGVLVWAGDVFDCDLQEKVLRHIGALAGDTARRAAMMRRGRTLVDGQGAERVAAVLLTLSKATTS